MSPNRLITIIHNNDLSTYLGDWKNAMYSINQIMARRNPKESQRYHIAKIPTPIESFSFNSGELSILLRYLDGKLEILEQTQITPNQFPHQAYAEARVFLKAFFIFLRILLDDLSGIIGYFYKTNEGIELPKSFDKLQKKAEDGTLPDTLRQLFIPALSWFPRMKGTRDDLVHYFDSILISFSHGNGAKNIIGHFNIKGRSTHIEVDTRKHIGILLSDYQKFIDALLDHFDFKFEKWYGIVRGKSSRTQTIIEDGISLWWAYKYGGYRNDTLQWAKTEDSENS